jgi:hypothetical protein
LGVQAEPYQSILFAFLTCISCRLPSYAFFPDVIEEIHDSDTSLSIYSKKKTFMHLYAWRVIPYITVEGLGALLHGFND